MHMDANSRLEQDVKKFLEVYEILSPEAKAQFESQLAGSVKGLDERTKRLHYVLLAVAKEKGSVSEAIEKLAASDQPK